MAGFIKRVDLRTEFEEVCNITEEIQTAVSESGINSGICVVHCNHTTAGIMITSFWDKRGHRDFMDDIDRLVPTRNDFLHTTDTPTDASGHIKSAIVGTSVSLIVESGKAMLGSSQGVMFAEFDGPRDRQFFVKVVSD